LERQLYIQDEELRGFCEATVEYTTVRMSILKFFSYALSKEAENKLESDS